uniref:CTCK domain-containing protein n=1 Tax=Kryptolebias marmoratus TaxID=37003 RepID=A0A3Q3A108_KRYMA
MESLRWTLAACFYLFSEEICPKRKWTFGSGVTVPFEGSPFYVHSSCRFTFLRFTHSRVDCDITVQRGGGGLLTLVEIIINKVKTVLREMRKVSLPYDHTYQHIFRFGVYTRLKSSLLPLSVTWYDVPGGIDRLWFVLSEDTCQTRDPVFVLNPVSHVYKVRLAAAAASVRARAEAERSGSGSQVCRRFFSETLECLTSRTPEFIRLCEQNAYGHEGDAGVPCVQQEHRCCQERSSERRIMTLNCFDLITRQYKYDHVTSCECRACTASQSPNPPGP